MGRVGGLGGSTTTGGWSTMDLFRYNASGVADYTNGRDGKTTYFSPNGGTTLSKGAGLSFHNQYNPSLQFFSGDTADWSQNQVFGSTGSGETLTMVQTELNVMAALGWKVSLPQQFATISGNWEDRQGLAARVHAHHSAGRLHRWARHGHDDSGATVTVNSIGSDAFSTLKIKSGGHLTATNGTVLNPKDSSTLASGTSARSTSASARP